MDIKILPNNIANMIAAGEVVQRPASVVKELVENAVDAGATNITVKVVDSGRTLIQVIDNGCGMTPDQAVLCFERHATSKLSSAEDLNNILTYGFRGEALASIVAVAQVELRTKTQDAQLGCLVEMANSEHINTTEISCPVGTNISVRNLFYNVPARRKFLKSNNVELKHIIDEFIRVALTRPNISFVLNHNEKDLYVARATNSLKYRIQDLFSRQLADSLVDVHTETSIANISGFIGRPDALKKTLGNQYFFVNGRFFKSSYLHKAVMKAYEQLCPNGVSPSYFIYLDINPNAIDVNIHPTKTEIKFEDDNVIFHTLYATIKQVINVNSFGAVIDFENPQEAQLPVFSKDYQDLRPEVHAPSVDIDPFFNPFESSSSQDFFTDYPKDIIDADSNKKDYPKYSGNKFNEKLDCTSLYQESLMPLPSNIYIYNSKYILSYRESGILFVNIKRAKERIFYERFVKAAKRKTKLGHLSLFPIEVEMSISNKLLLEDNVEILKSLGFDFVFEGDKMRVLSIPSDFPVDEDSVRELVNDIIISISEEDGSINSLVDNKFAERFAMICAVKSNKITTVQQAQLLLDNLFSCENSEYTSNGLKIMSLLGVDEIDKRF